MNLKIYQYALKLLSRQDYSEFKIKLKLKLKNISVEEINEVIKELKESNYLREDQYRKNFIKKWILKGESEEKIRFRASQENLNLTRDEFQRALEEIGVAPEENIDRLIEKKIRSKMIPNDLADRNKLKEKILKFLISKGHSYDNAHTALKKYL